MKKILSILVMCLILGVCSAYSATITLTAHAVVNDHSTSGGGEVVVHAQTKKASWGDWDGEWKSGTQGVISSYTYEGDKNSCSADLMTVYDGYYFYRWEKSDGTQLNAKNRPSNNAVSSVADHTVPTDEYHMYAVLKPVTVDIANNGTISVTDITPATLEGTVTFNVTGADNINDFYPPIVEGEGFADKSMSYANNVITVTVTYTVQNKDNVNGDPKPNHSATVTLRSKGDADGTQAKQATITATESLKPEFTIPANIDLTPDVPALTAAPAQQSFTIMTNNQVAANAAWSAELPQEAKDLGFSVENTGTAVTVNFTPKDNIYREDILATLSITGIYTDGNGKIITNTQSVSLSADKGSAVKIDGTTTASYDFGTKEYTGQAYTQDLSYTSNITTGITHSWVDGKFMHIVNGSTIQITLPGTSIPGDYSDKLSVKYDETEVASLAASAKVRLAQPQIESKVYMSQVLLTWKNVYGAKQYILKSDETVIDISDVMTSEVIATASTSASHTLSYSKMITAIGDVPLSTGTEYPFTLTVVYGDDVNNINDVTKISSATITATPTVTTTITAGDVPLLGIYTGTEKPGAYPYHKDGKRLVDLSAAFNNGVASFDQLFVFGLTLGDASGVISKPTTSENSNAVTPCYIYTKSGNNYTLSKTIPNVNIATKPAEFNIAANGQKVYFTGYAPYASCGSTWDENAVFLFTGNGKAVDVYFDNLELYARPKAVTGTTVPIKKYTVASFNDAMGLLGDKDVNLNLSGPSLNVYVQGSGAAFAFASTGGTLTPTIHLNGTNVLQSTAGVSVHVLATWVLSVDQTASQQSSPIQVLTKKDGGAATLTITDTWFDANTHTNGVLDLAKSGVRPAPTIDLGNEKTTLNFRGGQYFLANAGNTSTSYTVSYAISYRKKSMKDGMANMYAVGDDQPEGKVRFYDGSVNCSLLPNAYFNKDLYHNQTSMKCPKDTKIDGGTFNCDVLSCTATESKGGSPTNSAGKALCKVSVPIQTTNSNGTAVLASDWMTYAASHGANTSDLGYYGIKSMQPTTIINDDEEEVSGVNLMLPSDNVCFVEMTRAPWVMCFPPISMTTELGPATLGGSQTVLSSVTSGDEGLTHIQLTSRLFYGELDEYVAEAVSSGYTSPGGTGVELSDGEGNQHILNTSSYVIKDKIYWVRPVVANEWRMIVPPFDVANIYIVEAYPEQQLLTDFGDGKTISGEGNIYDARLAQSERIIDLFYYWFFDCDPGSLANDNDLWPKKGRDMSPFIRDWIDYEKETYGDTHQPTIEQLYHFTGSNWEANYYLYESDGNWDYVDGKFVTDWQLVSTQSVERGKGTPQTIMRKGGIYSMCFPYSIYNDGSHNPDKVWDYWTGKYIIMEGYPTDEVDIIGPAQVLSGTTSDWNGAALSTTIMADHTATGASLRGNHTFGKVSVQKDNAFYLNGTNKYTNPDLPIKRDLEPGEGFLLANAGKVPLSMPNRKASIDLMTGDVTYEPISGDDTNETPTSTPTISGDRGMLVYTVAGGLGVVPVVPQYVSIYNAAGQLVVSQYLTDDTQFALPTGIYLVRGEKDQAKAMVK